MKASASPRTLKIALVAFLAASSLACAQDVVLQKNNLRSEGVILGVTDGKVRIKVGPAETSLALDQIASITKTAPKAYTDSLASWEKGDANTTLTTLKPLVDTFRGLPTPWAERASALLGDVYISLNQLPLAESTFAAFQKAYPQSTSLADIGLARLAVEKKDYATAKSKLTPIVEEAAKVTLAPTGQSAAYGQAFYLMGNVREAEGSLPEALQDYLSAVTLFYEDQAIVAKAQARADILIKEKQIVVP